MHLRTRKQAGGTPRPTRWGIDSEYGRLRDVLIGPVDNFSWQAGNAVAQRAERVGLKFDFAVAKAQYGEMLDAYRQAGVTLHTLQPSSELPYQIFARDSSVMTPWGAVIMQLQKPYRRGEYAECLRFYLDAGIPIYDLVTAGNVEGGDFMVLKPGVGGLRLFGRALDRAGGTAVAILVPGGGLGSFIPTPSTRISCILTCKWACWLRTSPWYVSRRSSPSSSSGCKGEAFASFQSRIPTRCS